MSPKATALLSVFLCFVFVASEPELRNGWRGTCDTEKATQIATMEEELAAVKAAMKEAHQRIAQLNMQQAARTRISDLVSKTQEGLGAVSETTRRHVSRKRQAPEVCQPLRERVRLVNGSSGTEGRLEIFVNNQWTTVYSTGLTGREASLVCGALGLGGGQASAIGNGEFGSGSGPSWFNNVACKGDETHVLQCSSSSKLGTNACAHTSDAGAICSNWLHYPVRLVGGSGPWEGRVEVKAFGQWGSISSSGWGTEDAKVVCRELGYDGAAVALSEGNYGAGTGPVWLSDVQCAGTEQHVLQCYTKSPLGARNYNHSSDAGVLCVGSDDATTSSLAVRLANGSVASEGRVEIRVGGVWGTVCDDSWDVLDAQVVCRQLGYNSSAVTAQPGGTFGEGQGPVHMDEVNCGGNEAHLAQCAFPGFGTSKCSHTEDAGVSCE
ncbi:hypothetical protein BaRGS_00039400 [Batillaria attramentaria]|uniref:SRCR domain-containing protein n=1 Tax=Batillaria attramentaria TaxID=370345 RepID=A0ABD0J3C7_9CAEN